MAIERTAKVASEQYSQYLDRDPAHSRSEVVQLGFRMASRPGLQQVHGIDAEGDSVRPVALSAEQITQYISSAPACCRRSSRSTAR